MWCSNEADVRVRICQAGSARRENNPFLSSTTSPTATVRHVRGRKIKSSDVHIFEMIESCSNQERILYTVNPRSSQKRTPHLGYRRGRLPGLGSQQCQPVTLSRGATRCVERSSGSEDGQPPNRESKMVKVCLTSRIASVTGRWVSSRLSSRELR